MNIINTIKKTLASISSITSNTIIVNGKTYKGKNIAVINDEVYIDGVKQDISDDKVINITINGNAENVSSISGNITISGNVGNSATSTSGDIEISGSVEGPVSTVSGDITSKIINGSVSSISGDINNG